MKIIIRFIFTICLLFFITACSSDDTPDNPPKEETIDKPDEESTPDEETDPPVVEISGAELLFNGTAILNMNDPNIPYVFYNTHGSTATAVDDTMDGVLNKVILTDTEQRTIIEMDEVSGLPKRMYTSDNIVVLYHFKEENTLMDLAIVSENNDTEYIDDVDVSDLAFSAKYSNNEKSSACTELDAPLKTISNGVTWALGGWCKIKQDNNPIFQLLNLSSKECRDIYRSMFPCCQLAVTNEAYCTQLTQQDKTLAEITELTPCTQNGDTSACVTAAQTTVQDAINETISLVSLISENVISDAEAVLLDTGETPPSNNNELAGIWFMERYSDIEIDAIDEIVVGVEYCDEPPFQNECETLTEASMALNPDNTFTLVRRDLEVTKGTDPLATTNFELTITGTWSYDADKGEFTLITLSEEDLRDGVILESQTYEEGNSQTAVSVTISDTNLVILWTSEDNDGNGIAEVSYTEFWVKS
jgi:hypothetical protein